MLSVSAGEINGVKWNDVDGDGVRDVGEPGLKDWTIYLDLDQSGTLDGGEPSTVTDAAGAYSFTALEAGSYAVAEIARPAWMQTTADQTVVLATDEVVNDIDIGNQFQGLVQIVDDGDADYSTVGSWIDYSDVNGYQNDLDAAEVGDGSLTATWEFTVTPGQYQVSATWYAYSNRATDAPFTISDGQADLATVAANQTLAPNDFVDEGASWEILDTVTVTTDTLSVTLANNATNGSYVIADAVHIKQVGDAEIHGSKWNDLNGDGLWDKPGEAGMQGWKIYLDLNLNGHVDDSDLYTKTDENGDYAFTNLPPGTYAVAEVAQQLWGQTNVVGLVDVAAGEVLENVNFGNRQLDLDYGDAPDPTYPTLSASGGAYHGIVSGFHLGATIDAETDGQPNATATGDDLADTDDEDGVTFATTLEAGRKATVTVNASAVGRLDAWIDFNDDGDWLDANEQIFTKQTLAAGDNQLTFLVPADAIKTAETFARFRFSSAGELAPDGRALDGEVEDYAVEVFAAAENLDKVQYWDSGTLDPAPTTLNYRLRAARQGILTVELQAGAGAGTAMNLYTVDAVTGIVTPAAETGTGRIDADVAAAEDQFYLEITGLESPAQLVICNLLQPSLDGKTLNVSGTPDADTFLANWGAPHTLSINGIQYNSTDMPALETIAFRGGTGNDTATITGSAGDEAAVIYRTAGSVTGAALAVTLDKTESITIIGGGGNDSAKLYDSPGDDTFTASPTTAQMTDTAGSYLVQVDAMSSVYGYASDGADKVEWTGAAGSKDVLTGRAGFSSLVGVGYVLGAKRFDEVTATGQDNTDLAKLYDSAGDDAFVADPTTAKLSYAGSATHFVQADVFRIVQAYATDAAADNDTAVMNDSAASADRVVAVPAATRLYGPTFYGRAVGFETIDVNAHADDRVKMYDSAGNDAFSCGPDFATMQYDGGSLVRVHGTSKNFAFSRVGGVDTANMQDAAATADRLDSTADYSKLHGTGFFTKTIGFDKVIATATPGQADVAMLYDGADPDTFTASPTSAKMSYNGSANHFAQADGFRYVHGMATDAAVAVDEAFLSGSVGDDLLKAYPTEAKLSNTVVGFFVRAKLFDQVHATGGGLTENDVAHLYDSAGDDTLQYGVTDARVSSAGPPVAFLNEVTLFKTVRPHNGAGGTDVEIGAAMDAGYDLDASGWL